MNKDNTQDRLEEPTVRGFERLLDDVKFVHPAKTIEELYNKIIYCDLTFEQFKALYHAQS